jgi:hypothetical protein
MCKLKSDISDNKRLKANNLRKLLSCVTDYMNDVIGLQLVDFQGSIFQNSISAENLSDKFSSSNFRKNPLKNNTDKFIWF